MKIEVEDVVDEGESGRPKPEGSSDA